MKFVFTVCFGMVVLAAFVYKPQKEPLTFIGHAQYQNSKASWCVVRAIKAASHKQADSLFMVLIDSCIKADKGVLQKKNYEVWELEEKAVLKVSEQYNIKLKAF